VELSLEALQHPTTGLSATMSGSVSGLTGGIVAVVFEGEVSVFADGECPSEISGGVSALTAEGHWVDVYFDGPETSDTRDGTDDCDGCGTAWVDGFSVGEVCADFSGVLDWGAAPF